MAATIKIKNSSTANAKPTSSDLVQGELAINVTDKKIFTEDSGGNVVELGANFNGFKNRIINGAMMIDQRNAGASVTPSSSGTFTLDRWRAAFSAGSKFSVQQQSSVVPEGFTSAMAITSLAATSLGSSDFYYIEQRIEGNNISDLGWGTANAKAVTLSFWVRSSLTGTFGGAIRNSAENRSYPFSFTVSAANTWEQKSVSITGDTSGTWLTTTGTGLELAFSLGMGSTYSSTASSWAGANYASATGATSVVGTNGATFYITGVQLEKGSTATSFDYRPYGTELALCQRYCYKIAGDANSMFAYGFAISTSGSHTGISFPVTMRATPTLSTSAASAFYTQSATNNGVPTSITYQTVSKYNASIETSGSSGLVSGEGIQLLDKTGASYLQFSAEL